MYSLFAYLLSRCSHKWRGELLRTVNPSVTVEEPEPPESENKAEAIEAAEAEDP